MSDLIENPEDIELRAPSVREIMDRPPKWIIRWGIGVIAGILAAMLLLSWLIQYPDILSARVLLTTTPPPIRLVAGQSGRLTEVFVEDHTEVKQGTYLAVIENPASTADVLMLERQLDTLQTWGGQTSGAPPQIRWISFPQLGEIQDAYSLFRTQLASQTFFSSSTSYREDQIRNLRTQIAALSNLNRNLKRQIKLQLEEVRLARKEWDIKRQLAEEGALSKLEVDRVEVVFLRKKLSTEQLEASVYNNQIQQEEYQTRLAQLEQGNLEQATGLTVDVLESMKRLASAIESWKQRYLLVAPVAGEVVFSNVWAQDQYVERGTSVMTITPDVQTIIGKAYLGLEGAGKVQVGQRVNIKLDSYPFEQFGMLEGRVGGINPIPVEGMYLVDLELENGLKTTYQQQLDMKPEMSGIADIVTEDMRLLERVFQQFRKLFAPPSQLPSTQGQEEGA
ncbi:MAG: HlyD family efflux transporter periplasmic adaptor subunit [Bacteroidota bacterium]